MAERLPRPESAPATAVETGRYNANQKHFVAILRMVLGAAYAFCGEFLLIAGKVGSKVAAMVKEGGVRKIDGRSMPSWIVQVHAGDFSQVVDAITEGAARFIGKAVYGSQEKALLEQLRARVQAKAKIYLEQHPEALEDFKGIIWEPKKKSEGDTVKAPIRLKFLIEGGAVPNFCFETAVAEEDYRKSVESFFALKADKLVLVDTRYARSWTVVSTLKGEEVNPPDEVKELVRLLTTKPKVEELGGDIPEAEEDLAQAA